jgi:hypothetical protein
MLQLRSFLQPKNIFMKQKLSSLWLLKETDFCDLSTRYCASLEYNSL